MNPKIVSVIKGALVAAAGAALTYAAHALTATDFGPLTPAIVAVLSVVVNAMRKYLAPDDAAA